MDTTAITLYGCWRSSCSHRLQIALRLKQLPFNYRPVSLDAREQREPWFVALNPLAQVPVLQVGEEIWADSLAALESLEERFPCQGQRLLPDDPLQRLQARRVASAVGSRLQPGLLPLQIREHLPLPEAALSTLRLRLQSDALDRLEQLLSSTAGLYCVGDQVSVADVLLVAHLSATERMGMDLARHPLLSGIHGRCQQLEAFAAARPERMPDAPAAPQRPPSGIGEILQYKEPESALRDYLRQSANAPIPGLDAIRERSATEYGAAASKVTALEVCLLLRWLAASQGCRRALEIGVFTGSSSLALLDGLGPQGHLSAIDSDPAAAAIAQQAWQEQGLQANATFLLGDALELLPTLEPGFGLIYVDGANWEYEAYLDAALPLLAPRGVLVFDNVLWRSQVLDPDPSDASASGLARFNAALRRRHELLSCVLNLGDGLALVSRRDNG